MRHYSRRLWLLYKDALLPVDLETALEEHLRECEACLETYLAVFRPEDEGEASTLLSPDFTARLRQRLERPRPQAAPNRPARTFGYYTLAAAITLLLLAGGWFDLVAQGAAHSLARADTLGAAFEQKVPFGWSERLVDDASGLVARITGANKGAW